ncbi:hypothetical protein GN244_ATG08079 [Phytophthora infestans]|uniref:Uncharacterized protein n=1 Tax=Phytophthora infestans TaxID=4787 RepID=A0A833SDN7_PHYIN|nr:hypothetical protein GN244_ATG08079 [Phytophthora infestans]
MDVPSWHPANQNSDAARRLAMSGEASAPKRVIYEVVDTSTKAEREMVATDEENVALGGGRGLLDPSDRMYLVDQTLLEQHTRNREKMERQAALQAFRSNALKVQVHKTEIIVAASGSGKKSTMPTEKKTVVVVKAKKKRQATSSGKETNQAKKSRTMSGTTTLDGEEGQMSAKSAKVKTEKKRNKSDTNATSTAKPPAKNPATALLLQDYSSSSDDE